MEKKKGKLNIAPPLTPPRKGGDKLRVAIAMSGGVDSAVAAKLLKDQGYDVVGFMMKLWSDPSCPATCPRENACCDDQGVMDAQKVADMLEIPFYVVNAKEIFKKEVADYFVEEYKNLRTPNPCVACNDKIKFGWLLDFAKSVGCSFLATGHYARIIKKQGTRNKVQTNNNSTIQQLNNFHLLKGVDENKDQSYFLYVLNQEQLSQIMFPVGGYTKTEVRAMAKKWNLPVYAKRESQEICFIQDKDFRDFLKRKIPAKYFKPGKIVDKEGNVLGEHEGLINYTIGQRKGIEQTKGLQNPKSECRISNKIPNPKSQSDKEPLYVVGFDKEKNQLIVGEDEEVYKNEMEIGNLSWINSSSKAQVACSKGLKVKIRYRHPAVDCNIKDTDNNKIPACRQAGMTIRFKEPQRAITPGQSAVFYLGDEVIGGGVIV